MTGLDGNTPDLIVGLAPDGGFTSIRGQERYVSTLGGDGSTLRDFVAPECAAEILEILKQVVDRGEPSTVDFVSRDGANWFGYLVLSDTGATGRALTLYVSDMTEQRRKERLLIGERRILELLAQGDSLHTLLEEQALLIERQADGLLCSILLLSRDGKCLTHGAGPSLPDAYNDGIDGVEIGPAVGSCGTAAYTGKVTVVSDIATDPLWKDFKDLAGEHGLRACWSAPILSSKGAVLGTFAMYYRHAREPEGFHFTLIKHATDLCAIAIERHRFEEQRRELEQQMVQAQKLESLGVLAGGIAHDFNNLLTTILGNADLASQSLSEYAPARTNLHEIEIGARRAADLASQMLAYSGKGSFKIEPIRINEFVEEMLHLLRVSVSKRAVFKCDLADNLPVIVANVTQVRQVIMNLVTNASEAVGDLSGVVSVTTGAVYCDDAYPENTGVVTLDALKSEERGGLYVYVEVTDTGCGMSKEMITKIFDPFFTTKLTGRGLGLAATLGIVRGHGGALKVHSEEGKGSTFKALFPVPEEAVLTENSDSTRSAGSKAGRLSGTVLLVDDEETIRGMGRKMLEQFGLTVLTAPDGREALKLYRQNGGAVDLVLLDLTMPHMDGHETFSALRGIDENVQVVMCSGYTENDVSDQFVGEGLANFVQKPYTSDELFAVLEPLLSTRR